MKTRAFLAGLLVALLVALTVWAERSGNLDLITLRNFEASLLDQRFQMRGPRPTQDRIAIIELDDKTLELAPGLSEKRAQQARIVDAVKAAGAKVLAIDLIYADEEHLLPTELEHDIHAFVSPSPVEPGETEPDTGEQAANERLAEAMGLLERVAHETEGDAALAAAIKSSNIVVLGIHVGSQGNLPANDRALSKGKYGQMAGGPHLPDKTGRVLSSLPQFNRGSERLGLITTYTDATGAVRSVPLGERFGPAVFAPIAVQLYAELEDINRGKVAIIGSDDTVSIGDLKVTGNNGRLLINWRAEDPFPTYSAVDVIEGRIPEGALDGRVVIFGASFLSNDRVRMPWGTVPGMHVHATALDNLLARDWLKRTSPKVDALLTALAGLLVTLLFIPASLSARTRSIGAVLVLFGSFAGAHYALVAQDLWVHAAGPLLAITLTAATCLAIAYGQEGLQRQYLRRTFAHYLSDELVEELVADPNRVALSGERRELTVLFTDIRNFTTFSEQTEPLELASFLNAYFTPMTRAVMKNNGYVDKFIGDAVMAIFGAPVRKGDHAVDACRTIVAMHRAVLELQPVAAERDIDLAIGAGLNTGEMVVGNMGSAERFDYTVLGDSVNLAARVEGLTKRYGVFCLVGPRTAAVASPTARFRAVDLVRVKGKEKPVEIFELLGVDGDDIATYEKLELFESAMAAWRSGDFETARHDFVAFGDANPHDGVSPMYIDRLHKMGDAPPEELDWDGVYTYTEK